MKTEKTRYLRQLYMGTPSDMKTLEPHFALMAEHGWMIDTVGMFIHRYRAIEPCPKRFFVDHLPQVTSFDYPGNEDAQDYRRACAESGWTFAAANRQFHIFYAEENAPDPMPVHTDHKTHAQIYLKAFHKYELPMHLIYLILFCFSLRLAFIGGGTIFLSDLTLLTAVGLVCLSAGYVWIFGFGLSWYWRTRKSAKFGLPLPEVSYRLARIRAKVFMAGLFAFLGCMLAGYALEIAGGMPVFNAFTGLLPLTGLAIGFWLSRQTDTKPRTRSANVRLLMITLVVFVVVTSAISVLLPQRTTSTSFNQNAPDDHPVLTLASLHMDAPLDQSTTFTDRSIAVPVNYNYWEMNRYGNVRTRVYVSVYEPISQRLYNHYAKELAKNYFSYYGHRIDYNREVVYLDTEEVAFWGAEEGIVAYQSESDPYHTIELVLLRGKTVLRLSLYGKDLDTKTAVPAVRELWDRL